MISQSTIDALRDRTPEYLERVHGVSDIRKQFTVPWREDAHPSCKYAPKTHTIIDTARSEARNVFQLAGTDFGIENFPDQVRKVAEILGEHVDDDGLPMSAAPRKKHVTIIDPPKDAGFAEDVIGACLEAANTLMTADEAEMGRRWLVSRGITEDTWLRFGLGYVRNWRQKRIHESFSVCEKKGNVSGFITIPHFVADGSVRYCVLRTVVSDGATDQEPNHKEWVPKGIVRPLYNEHFLSKSLDAVAVAEGPIDAISLTIMTGVPAIGLGSTSMVNRFCSVLYHAKPDQRPRKIVVNMDSADKAGSKAAMVISSFLDKLQVPHSELQMPAGIKDANEWLQSRAMR